MQKNVNFCQFGGISHISTWQVWRNKKFTLFCCCKICFVTNYTVFAKSVLARFTRFCVEKNWAKNWIGGEKMTNMRYFRAFLPPKNTFFSFHSGSRSMPTISGEGVVGKSVSFSEMRFSEVDTSISSTVERSTSGRGLSGRPTAFAMWQLIWIIS